MFYVIFDLEWNNAYDYKLGKGINEIIEIGAVKLNEKLNIVDTFKQLIKPKHSKLSSRFKRLTHISAEEIKEKGIPLGDAVADFSQWSGRENSVFMSWSNSDLYVLTDNFKKILNTSGIDFIKRYADVQKYCQSFLEDNGPNQIGLSRCAEMLEISVNNENLHRALEDCYLAAECFKKVFDKEKFSEFVVECDRNFFERLVFKPYYITKSVSEDFNVNDQKLFCPHCKKELRVLRNYESVNKSFRTVCECRNCKKKFWAFIRAKRTYDGVEVTTKINIMNKKRAKAIKS